MNEPETIRMLEAASLRIRPYVAEAIVAAGEGDDQFGLDRVRRTARLAVAAWALAVNGDDSLLRGLAPSDNTRYFLVHPAMERWEVLPGPLVTSIEVIRLEVGADPPELGVQFEFAGRQRFTDGDGNRDPIRPDGDETLLIGSLYLEPSDAGSWPWQLARGYVQTLDKYLGYVFTSLRESAEDYQKRTGLPADQVLERLEARSPATAGHERRFKIVAGFAEHDVRFGSEASVEVVRDAPPTRYEAVDLVWPTVEEVTEQALGPGDWRPSLSWVDLIELID
ncbi:MAG TPA: hypothetical protein VMR14_21320 [Streptosporangiaceae bacterium]|jgi:hypothetical protein|nr:hypothetical protein [Streptosporangiaceae bacterium]